MKIVVKGGTMHEEEQKCYADYIQKKYKDKKITELEITIDGDEVELRFKYDNIPFQRIRRITGYLVGDLSRWNNAKYAEQSDRVKHSQDES